MRYIRKSMTSSSSRGKSKISKDDIFPNPVGQTLTFSFNAKKNTREGCFIHDAAGNLIMKRSGKPSDWIEYNIDTCLQVSKNTLILSISDWVKIYTKKSCNNRPKSRWKVDVCVNFNSFLNLRVMLYSDNTYFWSTFFRLNHYFVHYKWHLLLAYCLSLVQTILPFSSLNRYVKPWILCRVKYWDFKGFQWQLGLKKNIMFGKTFAEFWTYRHRFLL